MTNLRLWKVTSGVILSLAIVIGLVVAVQIVPEWQVNRAGVRSALVNPEAKTTPADVANLQNEMRRTILQVLGGLFAIFALYLTFRRVKVAEQGHITDRYTKAIEQLGTLTADGKPNVEVRLGAIYALERIAQDSPRDHWTIMEVLTAYVRQNAPAPTQIPTYEENQAAIAKGPATEIQAILTVLGRRRRDRGREQKGQRLDLSYCDLRWAKVYGAHLDEALFIGTYMLGAGFEEAHIERASFLMTYAVGAKFDEAYLEGANFLQANVGAAHFDGARINGTRFWNAEGLDVKQFTYALGWEQAYFDKEFLQKLEAAKEQEDIPDETTSQPET